MLRKILLMTITILVLVFGSAVFAQQGKNPSSADNWSALKSNSTQKERTFTKKELQQYNGQNGKPAYIAVDGTVYDVTNLPTWKGGKHKGYKAGVDLTEAIKHSPHGIKVLQGLPIVGKYIDK